MDVELERKLLKACNELELKYYDEKLELSEIVEILKEKENNTDEVIKCLKTLQRVNDRLFNKYGVNDEIIDMQLIINGLRNYYNIPDHKELDYKNGYKFVQ